MPDVPSSSPEPVELSKSQRKALSSAGYLVERFAAACDGLRARVENGRILLPLPWREAVLAAGSSALTGDGWFVIEFVLRPGGGLRMRPQLLQRESAELAVTAWHGENPGTAAAPLLTVPEGFNILWWTAFLRLRQLRDFWEGELRRNGLEQLLAMLPDAWLLDSTPLPPGAVVPRLEIGGWEELTEPLTAGRTFEIQHVAGVAATALHGDDGSATWRKYWRDDGATPHVPDVLGETDERTDHPTVRVVYAKTQARVDTVGMVGPGVASGA